MTSLGLTCLIFIYWTILGRSILALFYKRLGVLRSWLLAPAIGLSVLVLTLMVLNQAGFPLKTVAWPVTLVLLLLSVGLLYRLKPIFSFKGLLPFIVILLVYLVWISWPALTLHFNWISFVTDDYVNYCLAADRFKEFGFYRVPTVSELTGWDYTQYFWFMHVPALVRFGAEHQLSWISSVTGLRTLQVFMPMIVALGMVQINSLAALVLYKGRYKRHALIAALLLGLSPLFVFGVVYELIAQVGGVALLLALVTLLTAKLRTKSRVDLLLHAVPVSLVIAALAMFYPEVSPFAALAIGAYFFIEWFGTKVFPAARIVLLEYALVLFFILLRYNVISYIYSLSNQFVGGLRKNDLALSLFPFFLIPSGVSSLFGLQAMNIDLSEPYGSIFIFIGFVLLISVTVYSLRDIYKIKPYAVLFLIEIIVGYLLFRSGNDFGTYKMAMYIQPLLMASLAALLLTIKPKTISWIIISGLLICMIVTDLGFVRSSRGDAGSIVAEVQDVSAALVNPPKGPEHNDYWLSSIDNMIAAKLAAEVYRGGFIKFPSRDLFPVSAYLLDSDWPLMPWYPHRDVYGYARKLMDMRNEQLYIQGSAYGSDFSEPKASKKPTHYLSLTSDRNLFNKMHAEPKTSDEFFVVKPVTDLTNFIIFVHSSLGSHYYLGDRRNISFYQQETDYHDASLKMNALGRFFLLRIENPSDYIYLRIAASKTLMPADRKFWSHEAVVKAAVDKVIPFIGAGAANVFVGPLKPLKIGDAYYVALDLGEIPRPYPSNRGGLKALYNQNVPLDYRWIISYGRDISALSPSEYESLDRPIHIDHFPDDIVKATGLEFSGIYEDGWVSPESHFVLGESHSGDVVRMRFEVPQQVADMNSVGEARISINGESPYIIALSASDFDWLLPIKNPGKKTDIRISFTIKGTLPGKDSRTISAKLESIKLLSISKIDFSSKTAPRPPADGIDSDGWCDTKSVFYMPLSKTAKGIILNIDYPGWWNIASNSYVDVKLDEEKTIRYQIKQGLNTLVVPAPEGVSMRRVELSCGQLISLPKPDARKRVYCLVSAESNDELMLTDFQKNQNRALLSKIDFTRVGGVRPPNSGILSDGWSEKLVTITLPVSRNSNALRLQMEYPGWPSIPGGNQIKVVVDGDKPVLFTLSQGVNEFVLNLPVGLMTRSITIEADKTFVMPNPSDKRVCSYRLISLESFKK